jgi:hypothetical protein
MNDLRFSGCNLIEQTSVMNHRFDNMLRIQQVFRVKKLAPKEFNRSGTTSGQT